MTHWDAVWTGVTLSPDPQEALRSLHSDNLRGLVKWLRGKGSETGVKALILALAETECCERFLNES